MAKVSKKGAASVKTPTNIKTGAHLPSGIKSPGAMPQVGGPHNGKPVKF